MVRQRFVDYYKLAEKYKAENKRLKERYEEYEKLWEIAEQDKCNGDCDEKPPHKTCPECIAGRTINECGEIRDYALREIDQALKEVK